MRRRQFLGTGLAVGATANALLAACARPGATRRLALRPAGARAGNGNGMVRLASNENPLGLSPAARQALLEQLGESNRYPRENRQALIEALAAKHGVPADHVQLGAGSTEILQMAVHASPPDVTIVVADPTYEDVPQYAAGAGRRVVKVPLRADWAHDLGRMREASGTGPALVFVCNPNNPTGTLTPSDELDEWIAASDERVTFVVDEAYFEFAEDHRYRTAQGWVAQRPNVMVVRTFSKIHAMAGLRLGYALAQPSTIRRLRLFACNNNANQLVLAAGRASLGDAAFHERSLSVNRAARAVLTRALDDLGLGWLPSHTNFVMHRIPGELNAYIQRMRDAGFLVGRPFPPMLDHNRVSIGLPEEMEAFAEALRGFRARGWV